jgi:hypothetical protein
MRGKIAVKKVSRMEIENHSKINSIPNFIFWQNFTGKKKRLTPKYEE